MSDDIKKMNKASKEVSELFDDFLKGYLIEQASEKDVWAAAMMAAAMGGGFITTFKEDDSGFLIRVKPSSGKDIPTILDEMIGRALDRVNGTKEPKEVH